jgi:hypothetical protein
MSLNLFGKKEEDEEMEEETLRNDNIEKLKEEELKDDKDVNIEEELKELRNNTFEEELKKKLAKQKIDEEMLKKNFDKNEQEILKKKYDKNAKETDLPKIFFSKYKGLRIVVQPAEEYFDKNTRKKITTKGVSIQFVEGKFVAKTPEEVIFLNNYSDTHSAEIFTVNPKEVLFIKALKKVQEEEAEMKRGKQGAVSGG